MQAPRLAKPGLTPEAPKPLAEAPTAFGPAQPVTRAKPVTSECFRAQLWQQTGKSSCEQQ